MSSYGLDPNKPYGGNNGGYFPPSPSASPFQQQFDAHAQYGGAQSPYGAPSYGSPSPAPSGSAPSYPGARPQYGQNNDGGLGRMPQAYMGMGNAQASAQNSYYPPNNNPPTSYYAPPTAAPPMQASLGTSNMNQGYGNGLGGVRPFRNPISSALQLCVCAELLRTMCGIAAIESTNGCCL